MQKKDCIIEISIFNGVCCYYCLAGFLKQLTKKKGEKKKKKKKRCFKIKQADSVVCLALFVYLIICLCLFLHLFIYLFLLYLFQIWKSSGICVAQFKSNYKLEVFRRNIIAFTCDREKRMKHIVISICMNLYLFAWIMIEFYALSMQLVI